MPYRDYIGSHLEMLDVATGVPTDHLQLDGAVRGAQLDARRQGAHLQHERTRRRAGRLYRFDLATRRPTLIDTGFATATTTTTCCRSTARCSASAIRARHGSRSTIYTVPVGGGTPKQITPRRRRICTAGRRTASTWSTPAAREQTTSTSTGSRPTAAAPEVSLTDAGARRRPGVHAGRQVHLLQLDADRPDADLADEARRRASRSRSRTTSFNNWFPHISPDGKWIAIICFGRTSTPTIIRSTNTCYLRLMPVAGGAAEGDRLRLRRAGHDQRALVVARQPDARVRGNTDIPGTRAGAGVLAWARFEGKRASLRQFAASGAGAAARLHRCPRRLAASSMEDAAPLSAGRRRRQPRHRSICRCSDLLISRIAFSCPGDKPRLIPCFTPAPDHVDNGRTRSSSGGLQGVRRECPRVQPGVPIRASEPHARSRSLQLNAQRCCANQGRSDECRPPRG